MVIISLLDKGKAQIHKLPNSGASYVIASSLSLGRIRFGGQDEFVFENEEESKIGDISYEEWKTIIIGANCLLQWEKQFYPCYITEKVGVYIYGVLLLLLLAGWMLNTPQYRLPCVASLIQQKIGRQLLMQENNSVNFESVSPP
ncbi:hypothetical protein CMV_012089 [Castanea mollissima]|uniref:Uncharacterized protein n=1 Tax=Castanea mollissima TaxID=60419 RepID=A0A8J4VZI8_9ROSI|nr:hypothetical protein CMV_012089 [Castanea mollissima]